MLILTRKAGEAVVIGEDLTVAVLGIHGNQVRIGIDAPVFPTGVGMNRPNIWPISPQCGVPHGRGDEPEFGAMVAELRECSPRAWG